MLHLCVRQCDAVRCSAMQCFAVFCSVLQCVAVCCSALQCDAVCCSALQCVAVRCSALQCVAVCCSVMQYVTPYMVLQRVLHGYICATHAATYCNTHSKTRCNTLQHSATQCQHRAIQCNTPPKHAAIHCNTLQQTCAWSISISGTPATSEMPVRHSCSHINKCIYIIHYMNKHMWILYILTNGNILPWAVAQQHEICPLSQAVFMWINASYK